MQVYLFDETFNAAYPDRCKWYKAILSRFSAFGLDFVYAEKWPPLPSQFNNPHSVLFVHSNGGEGKWREFATKCSLTCHIVLVRRAGRQKIESSRNGNLHGCYWSPEEFGDVVPSHEIVRFVGEVSCADQSGVNWSLLSAPPMEYQLAMRLLCEAWMFTGGKMTRIENGVKVRAPTVATEWFEPFEGVEVLANSGLMGADVDSEVSKLVKKVLAQNGSNINAEVEAFLGNMHI